ncbi:MAG: mannose-6-phosphate isomerase, class I [Candidatus Binatia bacterium]
MLKLRNTVMEYDWGSRVAIAEFLGRPVPSAQPQAELWIGAHAGGPSLVEGQSDPTSLGDWISKSPQSRLGRRVCDRFGHRLPFLLKVLAAEVPLSLQAHPNLEQARAGHAREEALGIPVSSRRRNYKDANHKPEILCALGPFDALCGFRPVAATIELFEALSVAALAPVIDALAGGPRPHGVERAFAWLMNLGPDAATGLVEEVVAACRRAKSDEGPQAAALAWAARLAQLHPSDSGVVASLMLNHVHLEAGQALFLPAGTLHSYLGGCGIELMASSDNVLRAGLTTKAVDVSELLVVLDCRDAAVECVPRRELGTGETVYETSVADFRLSIVELTAGGEFLSDPRGPELLLCTSGVARVTGGNGASLELTRGESLFVAADEGRYALGGAATVVRATIGDDVA